MTQLQPTKFKGNGAVKLLGRLLLSRQSAATSVTSRSGGCRLVAWREHAKVGRGGG